MYSNDELETILIRVIGSHQSLDMKKHLIEEVTNLFDRLETCEDELARISKEEGLLTMEKRIEEIESLLDRYYESEDGFEQTDLAIVLIQKHLEWLLYQYKNREGIS